MYMVIIICFFFHDIFQLLGTFINVFDAHLQEAKFTKLWNMNNTNSCYFKALTDCKFYFILFDFVPFNKWGAGRAQQHINYCGPKNKC